MKQNSNNVVSIILLLLVLTTMVLSFYYNALFMILAAISTIAFGIHVLTYLHKYACIAEERMLNKLKIPYETVSHIELHKNRVIVFFEYNGILKNKIVTKNAMKQLNIKTYRPDPISCWRLSTID